MSSQALIIEDDQDTASLFSHILEFIGFGTQIIRNAEFARARLHEMEPEIVLLDILLGQNVSGLNILDYIKSEERLRSCRVIVITGYANLAESVGDKADLVLLKPISAKQLSTMVLRLLPNHICENFLYNASHDPMTGLMNYARFKDRLTHAVSRIKRAENLRFTLLFVRINELDIIQRKHQLAGTNQILHAFVERVNEQIREVDTFARLSEDKFAILLENIKDPENAAIVVSRIRKSLERPFRIDQVLVPMDVFVEVASDDLLGSLDIFLAVNS